MSLEGLSDTAKFVSEPKPIYDLSIEGLDALATYVPDAVRPSGLISKIALPAGAIFTHITATSSAPSKRWSTIQVAEDVHIELDSGLVCMNHSCEPSLEVDTSKMEVRVAAGRPLKVGDELSFFYPSTEYMMDKPFRCLCNAGNDCLGMVSGAADIDMSTLGRWYINQHILRMKGEQGKDQ